jgi:putative ABC transport system ATP-binding protein
MNAGIGSGTLISCQGVSVVYGRKEAAVHALKDVSLDIGAGETIGLLGPSGSGKTTLLHALGGLIAPSSGTVIAPSSGSLWSGKALPTLDEAARRGRTKAIAFVFQGANLLPTLDARENIAFAILAAGSRPSQPLTRNGSGLPETPDDYLALVGLEGKAEALPTELSGGEQQRVAIARALAQAPKLLLCDEPTGHLDSDTGHRVLDLIDGLRRMFGFAMVTATHDPSVAERAERLVELADGALLKRELA